MSDDPLDHMRESITQCRQLPKFVNDPRTTETLLQMAEQGEIDLAQLIAERENRGQSAPD
jgi:hypothetical protein